MSRPRVLLLAPISSTGGIASWTAILLAHARRTDFRVEDTSRRYCALGERQTLRHRARGLAAAVTRFAHVLRRVRAEAVDAVHITCAPSIGFFVRDVPLVFVLRAIRVPVLLQLHGGDIAGFVGRGRLRRSITIGALRRASMVIPSTRDVEAFLVATLPRGLVRYLPNMLPDEYWVAADHTRRWVPRPAGPSAPERGRRTLALVAWQAPEKGTLVAVRALAQLPPDVRLLLVGPASTENDALVGEVCVDAGVADRVVRYGQLSRPEVDKVLAECDVLLLPSATEGFPMVVLEAMAHAVPVVATRVGNLPEMLGGDPRRPAGILVAHRPDDPWLPADPGEVADAVQALLSNPDLAGTLGRNGRSRVGEQYLVSVVVPALETVIAEVATGSAVPPRAAVDPDEAGWRQPGVPADRTEGR